MKEIIELKNYEVFECCSLNRKTGETNFYKGRKKVPGFTGLYFKNDNIFFAIYPSDEGPLIFYKNRGKIKLDKRKTEDNNISYRERKIILEDVKWEKYSGN